jgi:hypothetical protein
VEDERDKQIIISRDWKKEISKKYCPNFFFVMGRSGFLPSSMSDLGTSIQFLI